MLVEGLLARYLACANLASVMRNFRICKTAKFGHIRNWFLLLSDTTAFALFLNPPLGLCDICTRSTCRECVMKQHLCVFIYTFAFLFCQRLLSSLLEDKYHLIHSRISLGDTGWISCSQLRELISLQLVLLGMGRRVLVFQVQGQRKFPNSTGRSSIRIEK